MSDSGGNFQPGKSQNDGILNVNSKEKESEKEGREGRKEERKGERRGGQGIRWVPSILYLNALHFNPLPTQAMAGTYSISLSPWADLALVLSSATGNSLPASLHTLNCARHGFVMGFTAQWWRASPGAGHHQQGSITCTAGLNILRALPRHHGRCRGQGQSHTSQPTASKDHVREVERIGPEETKAEPFTSSGPPWAWWKLGGWSQGGRSTLFTLFGGPSFNS